MRFVWQRALKGMAGASRNVRVAKWLGVATLSLSACGRMSSGNNKQAEAAGGSSGVAPAGGTGTTHPGAGTGAGAGDPTPEFPGYSVGTAIFTRAQRLTNSQFEHSVIDILGLPATTELDGSLVKPVAGVTTFTNNEHLLVMDVAETAAFEEATEKAAALATGSPASLERLYAGTDAPGFVRHLGRRAFRRPLSEEEVTRFLGIFARGEELYGAGFANGASLVIRAMLQSPSFLYRTELGAAGEPLDGYEIAAKLSFWLRDTTPSDALLDAAAAGELDDVDALVATARQMLEEPAASAVMRDFHSQLYRLSRFDNPAEQAGRPLDEAFAAEAKEASLRFFDSIFERGLGVRDIFTSTRGFVGPKLAPIYAQPIPSVLEERELGPERVGWFMQVPPLTVALEDGETDIIRRGVNLLLQATCAGIGPPATNIPPLPRRMPGQTGRELVEDFTGTCGAACHRLIDPLGFAFEGFDGTGAARDTDRGLPIDTSGSFLFSTGTWSFQDARELSLGLADAEPVYVCYGQRLAAYGLQREMVGDRDQPLIDVLAAAGREGSVKDLALSLVQHPAFRLRHEDLP
jgi:Protein of unknown function (DUF1592)/Protein of unknown function (DUF1595)/Protein of unknown function (DUF1588)/Protein of unknown function (DUF1587)